MYSSDWITISSMLIVSNWTVSVNVISRIPSISKVKLANLGALLSAIMVVACLEWIPLLSWERGCLFMSSTAPSSAATSFSLTPSRKLKKCQSVQALCRHTTCARMRFNSTTQCRSRCNDARGMIANLTKATKGPSADLRESKRDVLPVLHFELVQHPHDFW